MEIQRIPGVDGYTGLPTQHQTLLTLNSDMKTILTFKGIESLPQTLIF